jgi:FkbM family methyltransferase
MMLKATNLNSVREAVVMNPSLAIRRCRYGTMTYLKKDIYVGRSLDIYGEYSEAEAGLFRQLLRAGDIALDIGANIGAHTVAMAQFVGPSGAVYAFEAQRVVFQIMCGNLALNEIGNVHAFPSAVGRASGSVKVPVLNYSGIDNFGGIAVGTEDGEEVDLVTIDDLNLPQVKLMKIDVEGMELDVLLGSKATLARCRPLLYVENDRTAKSHALVTQLFQDGYRLWWHTPPLFNAENFLGNPQNVFGGIVSFNILGIPKEYSGEQPNMREIRTPEEATNYLRSLEGAKTNP